MTKTDLILGAGRKMRGQYLDCRVLRVMWVSRGTFDLRTGESRIETEGFEERECGAPLFTGDEGRMTGVCGSCARGYAAPNNYPLGTEPPEGE